MKARANTSVYWSGMLSDITGHWAQCHTCNTIAPSQSKEPPIHQSPLHTHLSRLLLTTSISMDMNTLYMLTVTLEGWHLPNARPSGTMPPTWNVSFMHSLGYMVPPLRSPWTVDLCSHQKQNFLHTCGVTWLFSFVFVPKAMTGLSWQKRFASASRMTSAPRATLTMIRWPKPYCNTGICHYLA